MVQDSTARSIGPVVHFRGQREGRAHFSVVKASAGDEPVLSSGDRTFPMTPIGAFAGLTFYSGDLDALLGPEPRDMSYQVGERSFTCRIPADRGPLRLAYASCNGAEDEDFSAASASGRNAMWERLLRRHDEAPFHLLAMGGDQVYADGVWAVPSLARWKTMSRPERLEAPFTDEMQAQAESFYRDLYATVWNQPPVARAFAGIPVLMMWDDHDIVDGWGSRLPDLQDCPVARGLFGVARKAFALCQLGSDPDSLPHGFADGSGRHFGWSGDYGPARIVVPDLRSERTRRRVLGEAGAPFLRKALDPAIGVEKAADGRDRPGTLLFISSIPMVNVDLSLLERAVAPLMPWIDLYQDDLRDQWMSYAHAGEWRRVMEMLFAWAERRGPVAVLSGEIHLAALGRASRETRRIEQFIASGIAHPAPPPAFARVLDRLARRARHRSDIKLAMQPLADGRVFVSERNWLEMEVEGNGSMSAVLHAETSGQLKLQVEPTCDAALTPA